MTVGGSGSMMSAQSQVHVGIKDSGLGTHFINILGCGVRSRSKSLLYIYNIFHNILKIES